jgi:hypothetical protein
MHSRVSCGLSAKAAAVVRIVSDRMVAFMALLEVI